MTRLVVQCLHSVESNLRHQDCLTIQSQRPCQDVTRSEKLSGQSVRVMLFYIPFRNIGKCATRDLREVEITCDMTKYEFCWIQFSSINRNISVEVDICISLRDFRFIDQDFHWSVAREIPLLKYMVSFTKKSWQIWFVNHNDVQKRIITKRSDIQIPYVSFQFRLRSIKTISMTSRYIDMSLIPLLDLTTRELEHSITLLLLITRKYIEFTFATN